MKKTGLKMKVLALVAIAAVILMLFVQALLPVFAVSPPNIISYQGRVLNTAGVPLTASSASMIFRFYTASSGGTCLWSNSSASCATSTAMTVTLTDGLFSVNLGDTSASFAAIGDTVFADNAAVFLDVTIGGETLSPRRQVVAAPYALNAENLDGFDSSQTGGTTAFVPVTDATGNLVLTGTPQSAAVGGGSMYVNPASATADYSLFGLAIGGSVRFRFDADGEMNLINGESLGNSTDAQFMFGRNDAGTVTITAKDNDATAALTVAPGGAALLTLGSTTATQIALTTDNNAANDVAITGGLTVTAAAGSDSFTVTSSATTNNASTITGNSVTTGTALALSSTALTTGRALSISSTSTNTADATSGNSAIFLAPVFAQSTVAQTSLAGFAGLRLAFTSNPTVVGNTEYMGAFVNLPTTNTIDNAVAVGLLIDNADNSTAGSTVITDAIRIANSGAIAGGITNAINIAATTITTDLSLQNGETLDNDVDAQFTFGRNNTGIVTITAKDDDAITAFTISPGGAAPLTLGSGTATQVAITTDNNASTDVNITGGVSIAAGAADALTIISSAVAGNAEVITADSLTSGSALTISADGLTSGRGFYVETTSGALNTSDIAAIAHTATYSASRTISQNVLDLSRALTTTAGTLTVTGALASISSNVTASGGTGTDSAPLLSLTQSYAVASGPGILITNAGTGRSILVDQNGDTGATVNDTSGGAIHLSNTDNPSFGLTIYTNQAASTGALGYFFSDNVGFDNDVLAVRSDATDAGTAGGTAFHITQAELDQPASASIGTQAMIIDVQEVGSADNAVIIRSNTSGVADTEFIFQSNGTALADGTWTGGGADYAEFIATNDTTIAGHEVVCRDTSPAQKVKRCEAGNDAIVGVISTNAAFVANGVNGADPSIYTNPNYKLVGLMGQIDTFASAADGAIATGDAVTISSASAGVAGKATGAGTIIGYALEPLAAGTGTIKVLVQPQWSAGAILRKDGSVSLMSSSLALASLGSANATKSFGSNLLSFRGSGWDGSSAKTVSMALSTSVSDASTAYRLSVANTDGVEVAYVSREGNFALAGRLYPSDRGALQSSKYIYYDGSSGPAGDFMRTNAAGWATGSYDFAEMFASSQALVPGDVVMFTFDSAGVRRSFEGYEPKLVGVVSTRPGFLAGENAAGSYPVALAGRVPTKVSSEGGAIIVGDPLTSSSSAGYAMKARQSGTIIGYALQPFDGDKGSILTFVRPGWYDDGLAVAPLVGTDNAASQISLDAVNSTDALAARQITSTLGSWSIAEDGTFQTHLTSTQGNRTTMYATMSPEVTLTLSGTATLENGSATIVFDKIAPNFKDLVSTTVPMRILVTASGPIGPLFVSHREQNGFTVGEVGGSSTGVEFDWLVIAYRAGYEPTEEAEVTPGTNETAAAASVTAVPPDGASDPLLSIDEIVVEEEPVLESAQVMEVPATTMDFVVDGTLEAAPLQVIETQPSAADAVE